MDTSSQREGSGLWKRLRREAKISTLSYSYGWTAQPSAKEELCGDGWGESVREAEVDKNLTRQRLPFGKAAAPLVAQKAANEADLIRDERSTKLTETSPPGHHANGAMNHGVGGGLGGPEKTATSVTSE